MRYHYLLFPVVIGFVAVAMIPYAHAATAQVTIMPGSGSGQNCEQTSTCFNPSITNISPGDTVTWTNDDNVAHTITDGLPFSGQAGTVFNSGPINPTKTYSFTFQNPGTVRYFATESKWMVGEVIVGPSNQVSSPVPEFGSMAAVVLVS
ncbi:MAG: hypothetical protein KGI25_06480, partial [Thaumarchaeota archaeon]|nr:hypothetical protein [Nitrososphaerota archaeon]